MIGSRIRENSDTSISRSRIRENSDKNPEDSEFSRIQLQLL